MVVVQGAQRHPASGRRALWHPRLSNSISIEGGISKVSQSRSIEAAKRIVQRLQWSWSMRSHCNGSYISKYQQSFSTEQQCRRCPCETPIWDVRMGQQLHYYWIVSTLVAEACCIQECWTHCRWEEVGLRRVRWWQGNSPDLRHVLYFFICLVFVFVSVSYLYPLYLCGGFVEGEMMTRHSLRSASVLSCQQKPDTLMPCLAKNWGNSENIKNWQQIIQNKVVLLTHSTIWSFSSSKLIWIEITRSHNFYSKSKVQKEEEQVTIDHFASGWVRLKVFLLIFPQRKK